MLNSVKKIRDLRDKKKKYSNSRVVGKKNSEKNITPPLKLNGRSLRCYCIARGKNPQQSSSFDSGDTLTSSNILLGNL